MMPQTNENKAGPTVDRIRAPWKTLEMFANLKESREVWHSFLEKHLKFFSNREGFPPSDEIANDAQVSESSESEVENFLLYQKLLRSVWASNDPEGRGLSFLFRIEQAANSQESEWDGFVFHFVSRPKRALPKGKPVVDGVTGKIQWEFSTEFQQSLYELMQVRWRAKVCRACGKYFIAKKTAQTLCSERCARTAQLKRSREYRDKEAKSRTRNQDRGGTE